MPLPGKAPKPLETTQVNFAADTSASTIDDDASCTGTEDALTAPAGKVCKYINVASNATYLAGRAANGLPDQGFRVSWELTAAGDTYVDFTWAYTAP